MGAFRKYCYPNQLQDLLGASYQVMNFGIYDRTLQDQADKSYRLEKIYTAYTMEENCEAQIPDEERGIR